MSADSGELIFETIDFQLLNKSFSVKCPQNNIAEFYSALDFLKMEINKLSTDVHPTELDKILVTTALNLAQKVKTQQLTLDESIHDVDERIQQLTDKVNQAKQLLLNTKEPSPSS